MNHVSDFLKEMWEDFKQEGVQNLPTLLYFFLLMFFFVAAVFISGSLAN